jgi:hypothetical protein
MTKAQTTYQEKIAGSQLFLTPGEEGINSKKTWTPSREGNYHYQAQGKYSRPGVTDSIRDSGVLKLEKYIGGGQGYVKPKHVDEYIKRYDQDVRNTVISRTGTMRDNPNRKLWDKIRGKNKRILQENPEAAGKILNDPKFKKDHQAALDYMLKNKKTGFSVHVG